MRHIDRINKEYGKKEIELLYSKAVALMNLLNDEEYEEVITSHTDVFAIASHPEKGEFYLQDRENLISIIDIFSEYINAKGLSKDEFNVMTLDEIKEYITDIVGNIDIFDPETLFQIIKNLEQV